MRISTRHFVVLIAGGAAGAWLAGFERPVDMPSPGTSTVRGGVFVGAPASPALPLEPARPAEPAEPAGPHASRRPPTTRGARLEAVARAPVRAESGSAQSARYEDAGSVRPTDASQPTAEKIDARARASWPYFHRLEPNRGYVSLGVTGVDPGAPRRLVLWRREATLRPIAATTSDAQGHFDFGQQLVPPGGIELQVSPESLVDGSAIQPAQLGFAPQASRTLLTFR